MYILWLLRARVKRADDPSAEGRHWRLGDLLDFFEPMGVDRACALDVAQRLFLSRLIETLDPTLGGLTEDDKISIKDSGQAHLDLLLDSKAYLQQMSLSTGLNQVGLRDVIRNLHKAKGNDGWPEIESRFLSYLDYVDKARAKIPASGEYAPIREARALLTQLLEQAHARGSGASRSKRKTKTTQRKGEAGGKPKEKSRRRRKRQ